MSLQSIIAKFFGDPTVQSAAAVGWGGWADTPAGKKWEAVGDDVYDYLEKAKVNVLKRQIIFDGANSATLTIDQTLMRIVDKTGHDIKVVREHTMLWLVEAADSDDEERDEDVDIESEIKKVGSRNT